MRSDHVLKLLLNIRIHPSFPIHVRNEKYIEFYSPEYIKYLVKCKNSLVAKEFEGIVRRCMGSKRRISDEGGGGERRVKVVKAESESGSGSEEKSETDKPETKSKPDVGSTLKPKTALKPESSSKSGSTQSAVQDKEKSTLVTPEKDTNTKPAAAKVKQQGK
jgi:hypothetical protein